MTNLTKIIGLLTVLPLPCSLAAQTAFSATPTVVVAEKPADLFVFYNYTELENLTGDTLEMYWVLSELTTSLGGSELGEWVTAITDPESTYNPVKRDTAQFTLLPTPQVTDKFIYQIFPNDQVGTLTAKFKFYPINDPADSLTVTFLYTAYDPATLTGESRQMIDVHIFPNPVADFCQISNHSERQASGQLLDMAGRSIQEFHLVPNGEQYLDCSALPEGIFLLRLAQDGAVWLRRFVVQR